MLEAPARSGRSAASASRALLWLAIQRDAFLRDPLRYLRAVGWRARGLKVRSRNAIAPLAGASPYAYAYWIAAHERPLLQAPDQRPGCRVLVAIDCRNGRDGLDDSIASVPEGGQIVIIGDTAGCGSTAVARPADLESLVPRDGGWIMPLASGDRLAPSAIAAYCEAAEASGATLVYADDDLIDRDGERATPHFKPDWNPELFEWHDFLTGACMVKATPAKLAELPDHGWAQALVREAAAGPVAPLHLAQVLHHRRRRPDPTVPSRADMPPLPDPPRITAIVPTRDRADLLRTCIEGLLATDYPALDIIVADNESRETATREYLDDLRGRGVTVVETGGPFNFSRINNAAVRHAQGEMLCFLNNDVEMIDRAWLWPLVRQAMRPDIGAVGARLLYPDGTIQHAGVFTGIGGGAAHAHRFLPQDDPGYFERARLPQRVSAVTGACLVVERAKFEAVGGFDEDDFAVAFNDVDLCLKLNSKGWQSFYEPRSTLIHHESKSRGSDRLRRNRSRFADELAALKRKWGTDRHADPYHHPQLSPFSEQFVIGV